MVASFSALAEPTVCQDINNQPTPTASWQVARQLRAMPVVCNGTLYMSGPLNENAVMTLLNVLAETHHQVVGTPSPQISLAFLTLDMSIVDYRYDNGAVRFHETQLRPFFRNLVIGSPGGLIGPAVWLASMVERFHVPVLIPENRVCQSACALIFFSSRQRYMGEGSQILLHRPRVGWGSCSGRENSCKSRHREMSNLGQADALWALRTLSPYLTASEVEAYENYHDLVYNAAAAHQRGWVNLVPTVGANLELP